MRLEEEVERLIPARLAKWNAYLGDKELLDAHRGSSQYVLNKLGMMPHVERAKHERFAQLLIHLSDQIIDKHSSTVVQSCLKRLQYKNLLEAEPYLPNRYDEATAPDRKKPAAANPSSDKICTNAGYLITAK